MPNTTSGYNGSTDFLKWYKQNYGVDYDEKTGLSRKEGMTDGDWDVGTILHNYYLKNQQNEAARQENINDINARYDGMADTAKAGFDSARRTLGENKATAQQNASIVYDKLRKYLPMKQRAQGLGGLGTQSAELAAQNTYMTQMGGIASDYQSGMRAIDENETSSLGELERYRSDSLEENDSLYDSLARSYGDNADAEAMSAWKGYLEGEKNKRNEAYNTAQSILSNATSGNLEELMTYVNSLQGKVSAEQLTALGEYAKSIAERNTQTAANKQQSDYDSTYNTALGVLQSAVTDNLDELIAYVNGLEGKVSTEQLAALRQIAQNVAAANKKIDTSEDLDNASGIVLDAITDMLVTGNLDGAKEFLENNKHLIGPNTFDAYNQMIGLGDKAKIKEEQATKDQKIIEGEEYVSYNGDQYRLVEELPKDANEIIKNDSFTKRLKALGYDQPYDEDIPNGTTIVIERDVTGSDKADGWDAISPAAGLLGMYLPVAGLASPVAGALTQSGGLGSYLFGRMWYVTYYNGKWYRSESMSGKSAGQQNVENLHAEFREDVKKDSSIGGKLGVLWDYIKNYLS